MPSHRRTSKSTAQAVVEAEKRKVQDLPLDRAEPFRMTMNGRTLVVQAQRPNGQMFESKKDGDGIATHGRSWEFIMLRYQVAKNARDFIRRIDGEEEAA